MNLYFLVEGKTEKKVYPQWLKHLCPELSQVLTPDKAEQNHYYIISSQGFPSILDDYLPPSIEDVNEHGNYDFLVLCIDSDDMSVDEKKIEIKQFIAKNKLQATCKIKVIVHQKCMETWFMGNRTIFPRNPSSQFRPFYDFYNVLENNPELMEKPSDFIGSSSIYHFEYLKNMLKEKNIRYSKNDPKEVIKAYYLQALQKRLQETSEHLYSLRQFLDFIDNLSQN